MSGICTGVCHHVSGFRDLDYKILAGLCHQDLFFCFQPATILYPEQKEILGVPSVSVIQTGETQSACQK